MQRVVVLASIPTMGVVLFIVLTTPARLHSVNEVARMHRSVEEARQLLAARTALTAEKIPALARLSERLPVADGWAGIDVLGASATADLAQRRAASDAAVAALGPGAPITAADLAAARQDLTAADPDLRLPGFAPLEARLDAAVSETLARNGDLVDDAITSAKPIVVAANARHALRAADASYRQLVALAHLRSGAGDPASHERELAVALGQELADLDALDSSPLPVVARLWQPVRDDPATTAYRAAATRVAAGQPVVATELAAGSVAHQQRLAALVPDLMAAADDLADAQHATIEQAMRFNLAAPLALGAIGLSLSLGFALWIARPARRLWGNAARIVAGDLTVEPLPRGGPREIAAAGAAINDLVANLRLIDAKGRALAALDLDAPVLAEPLPGRLGASLQGSVRALSGSIDERDELRRRLHQQATHDALTGLHNRAAARDHLEQAIGRARRGDDGVAVLHLDLEAFKRVNESYGNTVGDAVLREVAERLTAVAGDGRFVARLGADEFGVIVEDVTDAGEMSHLATRLRAAAGQPVLAGETRISLGASIGIAFTWHGTDDAADVLAWAELAVHRAKSRAAGSIEIYDERIQEQLREQAEIEDALTAALPRDELFLQYQPVIDLATGEMSSVEALVRWQRPDTGMQPPDTFIPVAERSDLIIELDRWVLARAARQLEAWVEDPALSDVQVAVNVSGRHLLSQTLYDHVVDLLDTTGITPQRLTIEITETVLVNDLVAAAAQLEAVRGLGVRIALDDFGTGYTSITHLRHLPIDIIKIDRSFVQRLASEKDRTLLAMITDLGHHLGLTITAEGVETPEQYDLLRQLGCDRAQGYLMSRPLTPTDLEDWARQRDPVS